MKTTSKIFSLIFLTIGIWATLAALGGATHQWFVSGLSFAMSAVLSSEAIAKQPEL